LHNIKYVFFDLDRTLWDFEANSKATLEELFAEFDLKAKLGVDPTDFIDEYKRINEIFWTDYRNGVIDKEKLRYARFEAALKFFGHTDRKMASDIGELYISRSPKKTGLVEGAIDVLEYLRTKYELHIITNGFEEVQHIKMKSSGLDPYFGHVITSERAGAKKPDPRIYQFSAELTKATPEQSIMIGDHFEADIFGALEVGWKAVFYEPNEARKTDGNYHHIHHLSELQDIL